MKSKKVILIVDDIDINRDSLKEILKEEYIILEADNGEAAIEILEEYSEKISAVTLDLVMPVMNGFSFLEKVKANVHFMNIPIIVTTGYDEEENEIKALELGAWDFISKPFCPEIIKFRIKNAIERSHLAVLEKLKYMTEYDELTGIYNKTKFFQKTRKMLENNPDTEFVLVRFDIDRFQLINSFFGSKEGDRLLKYTANTIKEFIKELETVTYGRMEADVFCVCVPYNKETSKQMLIKARDSLAKYNPTYHLVPSFGIYIITDISIPLSAMYDRASLAAKQCKGSYVDYYYVYNELLHENIAREQEFSNEMSTSLENGEFDIYLQPKYYLKTEKISGAEALVRWKHPKKGMVLPNQFIPIFERRGLITKLDFFVWNKVCKLLKKWIDQGKDPMPISVNVSRANLYNPNIVDSIIEMVESYELPPYLLNLELTESAYMDSPEIISDTMERLQNYGFTIMMDDFGSGYSSLNVLKDLPLNVLKIDMRFLANSKIAGRGESILASVVRMAKWINIPVIVEGVETRQQMEFLKSINCEYIQGYYYAKPMPVEEYEALMDGNLQWYDKSQEHHRGADMKKIWEDNAEMRTIFGDFLQAVAIYEYSEGHLEIIRVNQSYHNLFGVSDEKFSLKGPLDQIYEEHKADFINALEKSIESKDTCECEYMRYCADGSIKWIHAAFRYFEKFEDKFILFGALTDITKQKALVGQLKKYRAAVDRDGNEAFKKIFIVDDSRVSRALLKDMFKEEYEISEAENGKEALQMLEDENFKVDLILLDLIMPIMDGKKFLKVKNETDNIKDIPVVVITAEERIEEQANLFSQGVDDYITKPFVQEAVMKRIHNVIDSHKHARSLLKSQDS